MKKTLISLISLLLSSPLFAINLIDLSGTYDLIPSLGMSKTNTRPCPQRIQIEVNEKRKVVTVFENQSILMTFSAINSKPTYDYMGANFTKVTSSTLNENTLKNSSYIEVYKWEEAHIESRSEESLSLSQDQLVMTQNDGIDTQSCLYEIDQRGM